MDAADSATGPRNPPQGNGLIVQTGITQADGDAAGSATGPRNPPQGNGLIIQTGMTQADGHAGRRAALAMIHRHSPGSTRRLTVGADKSYDCNDCNDFVNDLRQACVTPHVAQKVRHAAAPSRRMKAFACRATDGRTTRHPGYAISQKCRKKTGEPFGWAKTVGPMSQTMRRCVSRVEAQFTFTMAACNLARLPRLLAA